MKYLDEFQDKEIAQGLLRKIGQFTNGEVTLMEVCGTHTMALFRLGIRSMLPPKVKVIAGPGCPVCVTPQSAIDKAIKISGKACVVTYGDMYKVPGSHSSLEKEKAKGRDIRVVYSPLDALALAQRTPGKEIVFLGIGFETTAPATASVVITAKEKGIKNFSVLSAHRLIPPAMEVLSDGELNIDGYLCPGHVSTIIGEKPYLTIAHRFNIPCVIAGFEALDILEGIYLLLKQIHEGRSIVENSYRRVVKPEGNKLAQEVINRVFETKDSEWRGIGKIKRSGLVLKKEFKDFDAEKRFDIKIKDSKPHPGCICGEILKGLKRPTACKNFGKLCTPEEPLGPCMVSSEGTCAAYYRYGEKQISERREDLLESNKTKRG